MLSDSPVTLLSAHHLPYRVLGVIEEAKEYAVLVTAYLQAWSHLEQVVRVAVDRGTKLLIQVAGHPLAIAARYDRRVAKPTRQMAVGITAPRSTVPFCCLAYYSWPKRSAVANC